MAMCRRCDVVCFWMGLWWDVSYVCCWATAAAVCWQSEWVMMWPVVPTMVRLGIVLGPMGVMLWDEYRGVSLGCDCGLVCLRV